MEIPEYVIREWRRHLERILDNTTCDPSDNRTANALRMARKDLRRMDKYISEK